MRSGTYPRPTPQQTLMKFISTLEPTPCPLTFSVSSCTCLSSIATPRRPHCVCQLFRRLPLEHHETLEIIQAHAGHHPSTKRAFLFFKKLPGLRIATSAQRRGNAGLCDGGACFSLPRSARTRHFGIHNQR